MPYATCPNCSDTFHINVKENLSEWNEKFPLSEDGNRYIECYFCWKQLKLFDVVRVFKLDNLEAENISIGDKGTVVMVHENNHFEIECVSDDGRSKWLSPISRKNLKFVHEKNH